MTFEEGRSNLQRPSDALGGIMFFFGGNKMEVSVNIKITPGPMFNASNAIQLLKDGGKVAREGWNGKGMYLYLAPSYLADGNMLMQQFIVMKTSDNSLVPWVASQSDLLAEDWHLLVD
jgi:hypothetical protein